MILPSLELSLARTLLLAAQCLLLHPTLVPRQPNPGTGSVLTPKLVQVVDILDLHRFHGGVAFGIMNPEISLQLA